MRVESAQERGVWLLHHSDALHISERRKDFTKRVFGFGGILDV